MKKLLLFLLIAVTFTSCIEYPYMYSYRPHYRYYAPSYHRNYGGGSFRGYGGYRRH